MPNIGTVLDFMAASGALGVAAFGIADGLKRWAWVGEAGYSEISTKLGRIFDTLEVAYGKDAEKLMRALYRGNQDELARVMRQGVRIGLTATNATVVTQTLCVHVPELEAIATKLREGAELTEVERNILGRFELAVDARIDAALTLARDRYINTVRCVAAALAVVVGIVVALIVEPLGWKPAGRGLLVGLIAVPLAPVAKDVVRAVKAGAEALRARS